MKNIQSIANYPSNDVEEILKKTQKEYEDYLKISRINDVNQFLSNDDNKDDQYSLTSLPLIFSE